MKCGKCAAEMTAGFTTDVTDCGDCLIVVRNVPCFKCNECDEIFYDVATVRKLEKIVESLKVVAAGVSVVDFAKSAA